MQDTVFIECITYLYHTEKLIILAVTMNILLYAYMAPCDVRR
jgi:hypothetical protein